MERSFHSVKRHYKRQIIMCLGDKKKDLYNYGFYVDRHRNDRYNLMRDFYRQAYEIQTIIDDFNGKEKTDITFHELDLFDLNIMARINDKVSIKKTYSTEKKLVFETIMAKGGEFGWHKHSDCSEIVEVESGLILNGLTDDVYGVDDRAIFLSGQEHIPIALENTVLIVTFIKD